MGEPMRRDVMRTTAVADGSGPTVTPPLDASADWSTERRTSRHGRPAASGPRKPSVGVLLAGIAVLYVTGALSFHYLGKHVLMPNEKLRPVDSSGGIIAAVRELLGRTIPTDFYADYASAHALSHGRDAYAPMKTLFAGLGPAWNVPGVNPHPPTVMTLVLPFSRLSYSSAITAWALAMIFCLVATLRLVGLRWFLAVTVGIGLAITFPGAYGIANPVLIIGLGVAVAYRYRDQPALAGLGLALAAAPKGSGLILAIPFLIALRGKTLAYAAGYYAALAVVPVFFQTNVWQRYLSEAPASVRDTSRRLDNGSLLRLANSWWGWSPLVTVLALGLVTVGLVLIGRDLFWPAVWAMVATLPIAWMYSLLTLVPLFAWAVLTAPRRVGPLAALAAGVTVASPPVGLWTPVSFPIVLGLAAVACALARPPSPTLWFAEPITARIPALSHSSSEARA